MQRYEKAIIPLLLGGDVNAYSVALAFMDAYGVSSHAYLKRKSSALENSRFIKTHICSGIDDLRIAVPELLRFAAKNSGGELYLIPCTAHYLHMLLFGGDILSSLYNLNLPRKEHFSLLSNKAKLHEILKKENIPHKEKKRGVENDTRNMVLTTFSDKLGRVVRAVLGEVILGEIDGCHSAIITRPLDSFSFMLIDFLDKIKYCGFSSIDIISDGDKEYVAKFDFMQGSSCDYLRSAGVNIAELLVKSKRGENIPRDFSYKEIYWHYPPHSVVMKYGGDKERAEHLYKNGYSYTMYRNPYEGMKRKVYVFLKEKSLSKRFRKGFLKGI